MIMELQHLIGFIAVAKTKSFSKAAKKTFRTQPAISLQIKALEAELGVKLFSRTGHRQIALTEEGEIFFALASPLLNQFNDLKSRFNEARNLPSTAKLTIATHASVMSYIFPQVLMEFKKKHPKATLNIVNRSRSEIIQMVKDGDADLGISSLATLPPNLDYEVFSRFSRVLVLPKKHPLSKKSKISFSDLKDLSFIFPPKGSITREELEKIFIAHGLDLNVSLEVSDRGAIKTYIKMGLGVSILNSYYIRPEDKKHFILKDLGSLIGDGERGVITRKGANLGRVGQDFIKFLHY